MRVPYDNRPRDNAMEVYVLTPNKKDLETELHACDADVIGITRQVGINVRLYTTSLTE